MTEGEQKAKCTQGYFPQPGWRSELVAARMKLHKLFSWNLWWNRASVAWVHLVYKVQLKNREFSGGSWPLRVHYKPVHLDAHFPVLGHSNSSSKGSEGLRGSPLVLINRVGWNRVSFPFEGFSLMKSMMTNCLPYPIFHHLEFVVRLYTINMMYVYLSFIYHAIYLFPKGLSDRTYALWTCAQ